MSPVKTPIPNHESWQQLRRGRSKTYQEKILLETNFGIEMHSYSLGLRRLISVQNINEKTKIVQKFFFKFCRTYCESNFKIILRKPILNSPKIMKIDSPQFKSCISEEVITLKNLFESIGHEIRIVGGAVRDLLMGIQPKDLDFASTATPNEIKKMFIENNIRMINVNGEKHGTITSRINDKNFEVTTLRVDLATDGRHAKVEFTTEWVLDANRRDLTINAMYLGLDGTIYDYFNGYEDLKNKRLVFVGDASARIQEDYLRILRYFRFYGKISEIPDKHDKDVLKAIQENAEGLGKISGERIWIELNKILTGKFQGEIISKMISLGIGPHIGFPNKYNEVEFKSVCDRIKMGDLTAQPMTLLAALFYNEDDLNNFYLRIKPSGTERDLGFFILEHRKKTHSDSIRPYQILTFSIPNNSFVIELLKYQGKFDFIKELEKWKKPKFPVNGHMLKEIGIKGPAIGEILNSLKKVWFDSNFSTPADELLKLITTFEEPEQKRRK